ncbi:Glycine zipper 2TM domain-containing protein [Sphingobium faniae]|nr:Glycine zipper 2TM domain-containing protein [Sphingobium faniae]
MRNRSILILGAILLGGMSAPALASGKTGSATGASLPAMGKSYSGVRSGQRWNSDHRWGPRHGGRWHAGWRAPGGWAAYRRPVHGYILPRYWINPAYYISNYGAYGLPAPASGYGWSRYYDDAVMTDRFGRVYDRRGDIDWGRYEGGYTDDDRSPRRDNGVGGAVAGAVVGGVAGHIIGGKDNRTADTLIGAGAGAAAGYAIDKAEDRGRDEPPPPRAGADYDPGAPDDAVTYASDDAIPYDNAWQGRWTGTWRDKDGKAYSGEYEGRFEGAAEGRPGADYAEPPYHGPSHWSDGGTPYGAGTISGGYYYPAPTVTTIVVHPATTTTTTTSYVTEKAR